MTFTRVHSPDSFIQRVILIIKKIPRGRVATYGQLAALAGCSSAARQVTWVLHALSDKEKLPWHRVVNQRGKISLPRHRGYELQRALLLREGIRFDAEDRINLERYRWRAKLRLRSVSEVIDRRENRRKAAEILKGAV
ncbi:MAG TPA: MGMT family protein [Bacteroidota bacterium]